MRLWIWLLLLLLVTVGYALLTNIGSSQALASIGARPLVALVREGTRIPVQPAGRPAIEGEARGLGGVGVLFGYRMAYVLPRGEVVNCTIRFQTLTCDNGWTPERAGAP